MSVVRLPCYPVSDPRAGLTVHIEARRYKRVIQFDALAGLVRIGKRESCEWHPYRANVIPFRRKA